MDILSYLKFINTFEDIRFKALYFNECSIGYIELDKIVLFKNFFKDIIHVIENEDSVILQDNYNNNQNPDSFKNITKIFDLFSNFLVKEGLITLKNEYMPLYGYYDNQQYILARVDRNTIPILGALSYGIHINCYSIIDNIKYLWLAQRSPHMVEPNLLDNLVAGAVSYGFTKEETLLKEAKEEANIDNKIAENAIYNGSIHYKIFRPNELKCGVLKNDVMHLFSLELPADFIPISNDKEASNFFLVSLDELEKLLIENIHNFKYNSCVSMIDFLLQHHDFKLLNIIEIELLKKEFESLYQNTI
jgi:8-oxo-dGTP pyrophosphatase MutT (NUDIX family)